MNKKLNIVIVGLGLIGGSYAQKLSKEGYVIKAIDIDQNSIDYAVKNKLIHEGKVCEYEDYLKEADLIIMCLYPSIMLDWLKDNVNIINKKALITDICGVKGEIVEQAQQILNDIEFIAAHPMAGKEVSGVENSDAKIFEGANFLIVPTSKNKESSINFMKELASTLGFYQVKVIDVDKHDEMIAFLSQLTHIIAVSLMNCRPIDHLSEYTGDSFRDLVRIAKINENMWSELFLLNKNKLINEINNFILELQNFKLLLENEDSNAMKQKMISSTNRKKLFDK